MLFSSAETTETISRGDIYWVDFGDVNWIEFAYEIGRELCGPHPAIVISPDAFNSNPSIPFVRVIPLTTARRDPYDNEVLIEPLDNGLDRTDLARVVQARAVDKNCLGDWLGRVSEDVMRKIDELLLRTNGIEWERW